MINERWTRRLDRVALAAVAATTLQLVLAVTNYMDRAGLPARLRSATSIATGGGVYLLLALLLVSLPELISGEARPRRGAFGVAVRWAALVAVLQVAAGLAGLVTDSRDHVSSGVYGRLAVLVVAVAAAWWAVSMLTDARFVPRLGQFAPRQNPVQAGVPEADEPT